MLASSLAPSRAQPHAHLWAQTSSDVQPAPSAPSVPAFGACWVHCVSVATRSAPGSRLALWQQSSGSLEGERLQCLAGAWRVAVTRVEALSEEASGQWGVEEEVR